MISFVEDVAASGGYWLGEYLCLSKKCSCLILHILSHIATAAPKIYVSNSSVVGSIGVICKFGCLYEMLYNVFQKRVYLFSKPNPLDYMRPFKNWGLRVG